MGAVVVVVVVVVGRAVSVTELVRWVEGVSRPVLGGIAGAGALVLVRVQDGGRDFPLADQLLDSRALGVGRGRGEPLAVVGGGVSTIALELKGYTQIEQWRGRGRIQAEGVLETVDGVLEAPFAQAEDTPCIPSVGTDGFSRLDGGEGALGVIPTAGLELQMGQDSPDGRVLRMGDQIGSKPFFCLQKFAPFQMGDGQIVGGLDPVAIDLQGSQVGAPSLIGFAGGVIGETQMIECRSVLGEIPNGPLQER
jgi:hypothetical protein